MSTSSAACDSLMKTVHVVCIDQSESRPSWIPERRTNAMTVSVRSTSSMRSIGVDVDGLGDHRKAAGLG